MNDKSKFSKKDFENFKKLEEKAKEKREMEMNLERVRQFAEMKKNDDVDKKTNSGASDPLKFARSELKNSRIGKTTFLKDIRNAKRNLENQKFVLLNPPKLSEEKIIEEMTKNQQEVIKLLEKIGKDNEKMNNVLVKVAATISKLHEQGKMNNETFNKLDDFSEYVGQISKKVCF